jgi:signal transduction histidine kinase
MSNTSILIIDDEPLVGEVLTEFLKDEGYDVHLSADGKEALGVFQEVRPELVITDLNMPGISGIDVIRGIREMSRDTPVIVITGYGSLDTAVDAIRLNVFDFISKPIVLKELKATLGRAREHIVTARKIQEELNSVRDPLALTQIRLTEFLKKMTESESVALTGRLLAGVLHNLNSPLTCIMGHTELLQETHPDVRELEIIQKEAHKMAEIIQSVLNKVRHPHVRQEEWLDLNQILKDEVRFLEASPYFRFEIEREWLLTELLPFFRGIAADFGQVFGNLLRNAAEAVRDQETKKLILSTSYDENEITITIRDNGPGIPNHLQDRLFQPFFSTKTKVVGISGTLGTGLGLYSCQQIVQQYGGSIQVISSPEHGAVFLIRLPHPSRAPVNLRTVDHAK